MNQSNQVNTTPSQDPTQDDALSQKNTSDSLNSDPFPEFTPEEIQQLEAQAKEQTDAIDPEADAIAEEFENTPTGVISPTKTNNTVQSTLANWTVVTLRDKMKKLRMIKKNNNKKSPLHRHPC